MFITLENKIQYPKFDKIAFPFYSLLPILSTFLILRCYSRNHMAINLRSPEPCNQITANEMSVFVYHLLIFFCSYPEFNTMRALRNER